MSVLNPLVRTVLLVKILLEATSARVNLAIQTGTVRQVSNLERLISSFGDIDKACFSHWTISIF